MIDSGTNAAGSGLRGQVLVVDDNPDIQAVFGLALEQRGYQVLPALSGQQALTAVGENSPDIVLLDLNLPDMNGIYLLEQLRSLRPNLPVIVVSGSSLIFDAITTMKMGACDYIVKPVLQADALVNTVEFNLQRARSMVPESNVPPEQKTSPQPAPAHGKA
ncbi:MAG TPA: response regulator [Verrucomicrobiae bacterium]